MKKTLVGLLVVLLAGGAWFAYRHFFGRKGPGESGGRSVEVQATSQDFVKTVLATGTVKPEVGAQVNVGARQSGKVEKLNAAIGDRVRKGQVLAVIEHEDLQAQVAQREAQLAYVRAQIEAVKSRLTADLGKADALIAQRHTEVETERRRLAAVTEQRQRELEAEQERLESIRQQRGGELKLARAQILESEASHTYAQKDVKRMQTLFDKGMLPEQTLDKAVTDENAARSRLHTTKEGLSLAQTRLDQDRAVQEESVR
jgi:multidrug efflux pump subunit AcrA (membrane-fusion protein)